jgi:hypothetical protein
MVGSCRDEIRGNIPKFAQRTEENHEKPYSR